MPPMKKTAMMIWAVLAVSPFWYMSQTNFPSPWFWAIMSAAISTIQPTPMERRRPVKISGSDAGSEFYIAPLQVSGDDVAERLIRAIERSGGEVQLQKEGALQATFTSGIFRFVDDVQFSWTADSNEVDVRSSSRIGHSDMGANRKRVEALRAALQ